jgi:hypothetical protein
MGKYYLNNPKKEFAEMAWALTENYNANPAPAAQKKLHDKLAQIMKGKYKASKEDIQVYKKWKNPNAIDLTKENEWAGHWDDMDEDVQNKHVKTVSQKFNIPTEKAALLINLLQKPGFTDAKAEAKIKEWGGSVTQGVYKTPGNFNPHDYSETAIGWKGPGSKGWSKNRKAAG